MGTTGTPNVGGMYLALLIIGAGMLIQLASLICALLSFVKLVRREPDLFVGQFYALAACGLAAFAVLATVLLLWLAGAGNLHKVVPLYSPSITAGLIVFVLWMVRSSRAKRRAV
ncbi:MAG TPA: hypothetical protein VGR35_23310 [Tepidisphaeraceae bacterium]|nr:hypothetical protein [Tepidisphaeraceae bacterium]